MQMDGYDCAHIREMNAKATTKQILILFVAALAKPDDG